MTGQQRSIRTEFKNYVKHAEIIHQRGNPAFYKKAERLEALDTCARYAGYIDGLNDIHTCKAIIKLKPYLIKILPASSNSSYQKSIKRLNDLLSYCIIKNNESIKTTL